MILYDRRNNFTRARRKKIVFLSLCRVFLTKRLCYNNKKERDVAILKTDRSMDAYLFHQGTNNYAYRYLGCHMHREEDQWIYTFRVWAPNAECVALVGDFLNWDNGEEMLRTTAAGIYETKISSPVSLEGKKYKYKIQNVASDMNKNYIKK